MIILCRASPVDSQFCKDYLIVKMAGDEDDDDWTYKIVPKTWMIGEVECHYPKDKMTPCTLGKMVEKGENHSHGRCTTKCKSNQCMMTVNFQQEL